jgi:DNA-binding CsgD family transcriptional regulator
MIGASELPNRRVDVSITSALGTALFWAWCLVWVSNAGDSAWPVRATQTFFAIRVMWLVGMTSFAVLMLRLRARVRLDRRKMVMVAAPLTTLGTLAVVLVTGHAAPDVLVLAVTSLLTGFAAGTLLPTWAPMFDTGNAVRLTLALTVAALGAVMVFHFGSLMPYAVGSAIFVALPLLAGGLSLLDRSEPIAEPPALEAPPRSYVAPDVGYVVFGLISGFTFGLNLLTYRVAPHTPLAETLIAASAIAALGAAMGLYALRKRAHLVADFNAALPLVVVGVLTLPYVFVSVGSLLQVVVAANYLCSAMLFNLSRTDTTYLLNIGRKVVHLSTRAMGAAVGIVGALLGLWVSHALDLRSTLVIGLIIGISYTLLVAMSLIVSTRVSIFSRATQVAPAGPIPEMCAEIARRYRLTPREEEILAILATGRSQAYVQQALVIAPGTATTHIAHIYQKLGIHSRSELLDLVEECTQAHSGREESGS